MQSKKSSFSPALSVVVIVYNMRREAPRTLHSLSAAYQRDVNPRDYEVVVIDNGSSQPLGPDVVREHGDNFRYYFVKEASPSPAAAVNFGVAQASGEYVGIVIDGARILTPGVIGCALRGLRGFPRAIISTIGFHLGPADQRRSMERGYDAKREDELLSEIQWPMNGYRLYEIGVLSRSSRDGWFACPRESNCVFMERALFHDLDGYDESFDLPGGGFVNPDFWRRACELPQTILINLLGEATFHQVHGGIATNARGTAFSEYIDRAAIQYRELRRQVFSPPARETLLLGELTQPALRWLEEFMEKSGRARH